MPAEVAPESLARFSAGTQSVLMSYLGFGIQPPATTRVIKVDASLTSVDGQVLGYPWLEVIDLLKQPQLAAGVQIFAIPTLVRKVPVPIRKIIGDLSNTERVLMGLDLLPRV